MYLVTLFPIDQTIGIDPARLRMKRSSREDPVDKHLTTLWTSDFVSEVWLPGASGNLPNNYTRAMVCTMMDKEGFKACRSMSKLFDWNLGCCWVIFFQNGTSPLAIATQDLFWHVLSLVSNCYQIKNRVLVDDRRTVAKLGKLLSSDCLPWSPTSSLALWFCGLSSNRFCGVLYFGVYINPIQDAGVFFGHPEFMGHISSYLI